MMNTPGLEKQKRPERQTMWAVCREFNLAVRQELICDLLSLINPPRPSIMCHKEISAGFFVSLCLSDSLEAQTLFDLLNLLKTSLLIS